MNLGLAYSVEWFATFEIFQVLFGILKEPDCLIDLIFFQINHCPLKTVKALAGLIATL